jgi:hypothetical protein
MQILFHIFQFKIQQQKLNMKPQHLKLVKNKSFTFYNEGFALEKAVELMISGLSVKKFLQNCL